jgi:hypothetical protein
LLRNFDGAQSLTDGLVQFSGKAAGLTLATPIDAIEGAFDTHARKIDIGKLRGRFGAINTAIQFRLLVCRDEAFRYSNPLLLRIPNHLENESRSSLSREMVNFF